MAVPVLPILNAASSLAQPVGDYLAARQLFGPEQQARLNELERPGLTAQSEKDINLFRQDLFAPILQAQQQQQQDFARALTPAAAGGALGATARGFQGAEQRMSRALESPQLKVRELRSKRERKEQEDQAELEADRQEMKTAKRKAALQVLGVAAQAGVAFEEFAGKMKSQKEALARSVSKLNVGDEDAIGAGDMRDAYNLVNGDGAFERALSRNELRSLGEAQSFSWSSPAGAMSDQFNTAVQMHGAGQALAPDPIEEAAGYAAFENPASFSSEQVDEQRRRIEALRSLGQGI
jgi:hypothetical protein